MRCPACHKILAVHEGPERNPSLRLRCAACSNVFVLADADPIANAGVAPSPRAFPTPDALMPGDEVVTLRDYASVVRRRLWVLVAAFLAVVVTTAVYTFSQEPTYRAMTTLIVEPNAPELAGIGDAASHSAAREFYETQWGIIRSDKVLKQVFDAARLADDPVFAGVDDAARALRERVSVNPVPDSRLVRLGFEHPSRDTAVRLADVLADVFIQYTMDDRRASSRNTFEWLSQQLVGLKDKVESSERALLEFRDKEDVISLQRRQELLEERLAGLSESFNQVSAHTAELKTILVEVEKLRRNPELVESMPRILESSLVQKLKQELSEHTVELAKVQSRYKPKHPEVVSLESQIAAIKERLGGEVDKIYASLEIEYRLSAGKEASVKASLGEAKQESMSVAERSIRYRVLEREANSNRQIYDVLLQRLREADISGNVSGQNIRILDRATAPAVPYKPRVVLNLAIAVLAGLLSGVGLCFLVEHVDNTVKTDEDVTQLLHERLVGIVPRQKGKLETDEDVSDLLLSAYASIRTTLRLAARERVLKSVLITSALRAEGKTLSAVCLASAFARSGVKVVLVDTDMFQASVAKRLRLRQEHGLSDFFLQGASLDEIVQHTTIHTLDVIPAGLIPPNPAEPLGSQRMQWLIDELERRYELVIVDSPPVTAALDVAFLAAAVDGVVVAVRANRTARPLVKKVLSQLRGARANVLGVMLTAVDATPEGAGYYYRYGAKR